MKAMKAAALTRIDEWVYRFRKELEAKCGKIEDPFPNDIDRVAIWVCDSSGWRPEDPVEAEK